jgi:hypothetical protein
VKRPFARGLALALVATGVVAQEPAPTVDRVSVIAPGQGAVVAPQTLFEIGYEAMSEPHPRHLAFRIRLFPTGDRGRAYVFDQREAPSGWLVGEPGRVLYRPRRPLEDGAYRWEAAAWNGIDWVRDRTRPEIRVDGVPPADVEGVRVSWDPEGGMARLEWEPAALDREGRPEYVARYHVYRYQGSAPFRRVRIFEVGVVTEPRFVDAEPPPPDQGTLFYQVTAEDEAGNEGGTR